MDRLERIENNIDFYNLKWDHGFSKGGRRPTWYPQITPLDFG